MPRRIVIASGNAHKVSEIEAMLAEAGVGLEVVGMKAAGEPPEIEETATTFGGNAALKAEGIAAWLREGGGAGDDLVLADDSGICIDAFDGAPGVYSARYAGSPCDDDAVWTFEAEQAGHAREHLLRTGAPRLGDGGARLPLHPIGAGTTGRARRAPDRSGGWGANFIVEW